MVLTNERAAWYQANPDLDITVWLYESNINVGMTRRPSGLSTPSAVAENEVEAGDIVEFFDDVALTPVNTQKTPVMRPLTGAGLSYQAVVVEVFQAEVIPTENQTDLETMLIGKYLRKARVQPFGMTAYYEYETKIKANGEGADSIAVGAAGQTAIDLSDGMFVFEESSESDEVPLLHLDGSTSADVSAGMVYGYGLQLRKKIE